MTVSALTRPGERDRLIVKLAELDWVFVLVLSLIAGAGALMLFSIAGSSWSPWAGAHVTRFAICLVMMIALAMVDIRVWSALAYPIYGVGLLLLVAVEVAGDTRLGAQRWLSIGGFSFQPSEIMKIGIVLALARLYHGVSAQQARMSWWLLIPAVTIGVPVLLVAHQPDLGTAMLIALTGATMVILAGLSWRIIAAGATATFTLYVLINGAMVMGLAPVVGVPMPLLSYGGTVMLTVMIGFGLVQSVRVHRYSEVTSGKGSFV